MDARALWRATTLILALHAASPRAADAQSRSLPDVLRDVAAYVDSYLSHVQSIVGLETVVVQPLRSDLTYDGFGRTLVYELRLDWAAELTGAATPKVVRDLVKVNGRAPRPKDEPQCLDPRAITPEPLEFLMSERQERFLFTSAGGVTLDGRRAQAIDYRGRVPEPVDVRWKENCATIDLPGRTRGRVWVDAETSAILRLDEGIIGQVDLRVPAEQQRRGAARFMVLERADTTIRYKPVTFDEPRETLFLPATVDSLQVIRDAGVPRLRVRHQFSNYRRFVTGGRIVQ